MILKYIALGLVSGISYSLISWMIGIIFNGIFSRSKFYLKISNFNFVTNRLINRLIGIHQFKWIVKNTFFKYFNQKIIIHSRSNNLYDLRKEMTLAEISHLVGFLFVLILVVYYCYKVSVIYGMAIMIPNILFNLYPSLLQQENKRRIDRLINSNQILN